MSEKGTTVIIYGTIFRESPKGLLDVPVIRSVDLLQVSLLINTQTGEGKKKKRERKGEGERDLWTTRSENETGQDLDRRLSFILAWEPIRIEQVNAEPRFRNA